MNLDTTSVVSLTPAEPGWTVHIEGEVTPTEKPVVCPVVAWAVVVGQVFKDGNRLTAIEPAFLVNGGITVPGQYEDTCGEARITIHRQADREVF